MNSKEGNLYVFVPIFATFFFCVHNDISSQSCLSKRKLESRACINLTKCWHNGHVKSWIQHNLVIWNSSSYIAYYVTVRYMHLLKFEFNVVENIQTHVSTTSVCKWRTSIATWINYKNCSESFTHNWYCISQTKEQSNYAPFPSRPPYCASASYTVLPISFC